MRRRLADLAWEEGLSAFITNGVPFSFSSGRVLADGIAHLVNAISAGRDKVKVMEMGAGIGYLSAFCLDALNERFPKAYQKADFVVTDGEATLVRDAGIRGVLCRHPNQSRFGVAGLRDQPSIVRERPHVVLLSYLLDAIPPQHLADDGVILVGTEISEEVTVFDGSVWPPAVLSAAGITERLNGSFGTITPALARKIVPYLEESWVLDRAEDHDGQVLLRNSRHVALQELCVLLDGLEDHSMLVVTDFGYASDTEIGPSELMTEYSLCAFWAVFFDEIQALAKVSGFESYLLQGEAGETHTLVIYKGNQTDLVYDAFVAGFDGMVSDRPRFVLYNLDEDAGLPEIHEAIQKIETTMPEQDVNSYGNLSRFAHLLLQFGDQDGALNYAERCVEKYPEVAAPELTILGSLAGKRRDYDSAESYFLRAIDLAYGHGDAHLGLSGVYKALQDWSSYLKHVRAYIETADCDVVEVMEGVAETLRETELSQESERADIWLRELREA